MVEEEVFIPTWFFDRLFGKTPGFYYTCTSCDHFLEHKCRGSMTLYYPTDCDMCSFGGRNVKEAAFEEQEAYEREMEERLMYGEDYDFIC